MRSSVAFSIWGSGEARPDRPLLRCVIQNGRRIFGETENHEPLNGEFAMTCYTHSSGRAGDAGRNSVLVAGFTAAIALGYGDGHAGSRARSWRICSVGAGSDLSDI